MTLAETARCQGDRDSGQNHAKASGQQEKALCPAQGVADARLAIIDIDEALSGLELRLQPGDEGVQPRRLSGVELTILYPTARLDHAGRRNVRVVHQHPRPVPVKSGRLIRLRPRGRGDAELGLTNGYRAADLDLEQREKTGVEPYLAAWGTGRCRLHRTEGFLAVSQLATQRIAL